MAVSTTISQKTYRPGAAMVPEALTGIVYTATAQIVVCRREADDAAWTPAYLDDDYELGGDGAIGAGWIRALNAETDAVSFLIQRQTDLLQQRKFPPHQPLPSQSVEQGLDHLTLAIQDAQRGLGEAIRFAPGSAMARLPPIEQLKGGLLGFDVGSGDPVAVSPGGSVADAALVPYTAPSAGVRSVADVLKDRVNLFDWLTSAQVADVRSGAGTIGIATQLQVLTDTLHAAGGGIIQYDGGSALIEKPVRLYNNVSIRGPAGGVDGFNYTRGAAVFRQSDTATGNVVDDIIITAAGAGYTAATIAFSNGATGTVYVQGGQVAGVTITDCGVPTNGAITATISGDGAGATVAVQPCVPMFYQQGEAWATLGMHNITLVGSYAIISAGFLLSKGTPFFQNIRAYKFCRSALKRYSGAGGQITGAQMFGVHRMGLNPGTTAYYCGTLDDNGTDLQICNAEIGADYSGDSTNLWNCAIRLGGNGSAAQLINVVAEGADVGILDCAGTGMFANVRCDINFGHGIWLHRTNPALSPPWYNKVWGLWCHGNGRYADNSYDNLRIEAGDSIVGTLIGGYYSSNITGRPAQRYGMYDGGTNTQVANFADYGAATAKFATSGANSPGPVQAKSPLTGMAAASSMAISGLREVRVSNGGGAVTINNLTGGFHGDELVLQTTASNVTLAHGGTSSTAMFLAGEQNRLLRAYETVMFRNIAGTWFEITPWSKQGAITALTPSATSGSLPVADGSMTVANAALPTVTELLEFCVELNAKVNALRAALTAAGITS